ncbi:hypothetical protein WA538_001200, partial [Blastocystis sp. DL]
RQDTERSSKPSRPVYEYDDGSHNRNQGNTLHIGNLTSSTTKDDLHEAFIRFGRIKSIEIPTDNTGRSRGFAFLAYETAEEAQKALNERIITHGSTLSIHLSKRDVGYKPTPGIFMGKLSYRDHRPSVRDDSRDRSRHSHHHSRSRHHSSSRHSPSRRSPSNHHDHHSHRDHHDESRHRSHYARSRSHDRSGSRRVEASRDGKRYDFVIHRSHSRHWSVYFP